MNDHLRKSSSVYFQKVGKHSLQEEQNRGNYIYEASSVLQIEEDDWLPKNFQLNLFLRYIMANKTM